MRVPIIRSRLRAVFGPGGRRRIRPFDSIRRFDSVRRFGSARRFGSVRRFGSARLADRIVFVENSGIAEVGSHAQLMDLGGRFVVKCATKPPFTEWLRREHAVLQRLSLHLPLVPEPSGYAEAEEEVGRSYWLIMEYRPGQPLTEALAEAGDEVRRRSLLFEFGRTLAEIHRRTAPPELAHPEPWLEHMLRLAEQYLREFDVDGDAALLQRLWDERPEPVPPCLIHGDYTLDNVLVHDGRVSGVIDWCWGALGDPRYDLALATRRKPVAFGHAADLEAFYEGCGGRRLSRGEKAYFLGLYEFL